MSKIYKFLYNRKYELLLIALIQHLYIGIFLRDLDFYTKIIWLITMIVLGVASIGIFIEKGRWKNFIRKTLFCIVLALPVGLAVLGNNILYLSFLSLVYTLFFLFILWEVLKFLVRPSYINTDIISASACGYFLLIEVCTFLLQYFAYQNPQSFKGIDYSNTASTYIDLVYFSSITLTSIGFGDITPTAHYTKLITSFFGVAGQFYSVVLVGILISKFSSKTDSR
jgi:hypothetical protein